MPETLVIKIKFATEEMDRELDALKEFLSFRHFYRNHYSSHLDPAKVRDELLRYTSLWLKIKQEINIFLSAGEQA